MVDYNISYIADLVVCAQQNSSSAFAELYALTYNKTYNYTRHYLKDEYLAQDALQEIYIMAFKNLKTLNDPNLFLAWLNRISFNICYDMSQSSKKNTPNTDDPDEILTQIQDSSNNGNPEKLFESKDESARLHQALDFLPFHEKQVIVMRFYNEMKLEEIASALDISRSSVKRYLASGRQRLKEYMH